MRIYVIEYQPEYKRIPVDIPATVKIEKLMRGIETTANIKISEQIITLRGKVLSGNQTLVSAGIVENDEVCVRTRASLSNVKKPNELNP